MSPFESIVRRMMSALLVTARESGVAVCPRSMVTEAQRVGVDPVRAERYARLRLAVQ